MNIPKFTAEASLDKIKFTARSPCRSSYALPPLHVEVAHQDHCITPAMMCFGDDDCTRLFSGTSCPPGRGICFNLPRGGVICTC